MILIMKMFLRVGVDNDNEVEWVSDDVMIGWFMLVLVDGIGWEVFVDDAVAICCCFAVNSTGIGSVKASSTLGNGPRDLFR